MAVNPRSHKLSDISESLSDLKALNRGIQLDDQVKEIQAGRLFLNNTKVSL